MRVSSPFLEESDIMERLRCVGDETLEDLPERMPLVSSTPLSSTVSIVRRSPPPADN